MRAPQPFADDDHLRAPGLVIISREHTSGNRLDPEGGEIIPCGPFALHTLGRFAGCQVEARAVGAAKFCERRALLLKIGEVSYRETREEVSPLFL